MKLITTIKEWKENDNINNEIELQEKFEEICNQYKYFHVSQNKIPLEIVNTKVPRNPYMNGGSVIEDDFTKRISLAPSINACIEALSSDINKEYLYVYAVDLKNDSSDDIDVIDLDNKMKTCPTINGGKYDSNFNLGKWIDEYNSKNNTSIDIDYVWKPSQLPIDIKKQFYACVPDADITEEVWSIHDLKMDYIGIIEADFNDKKLYNLIEIDYKN